MLRRFLLFLVFFLLSSAASAEVIHLRNGRKVTGRIMQKTGYGIIVEVDGVARTYYKNEIDRIEEEPRADFTGEKAPEAPELEPEPAPAVPDFSEIPPQKAELTLRLLDASGARNSIATVFDSIIKEAPKKDRPRLQAILKVDEVMKSIAPLYAQHYTEEEMKELIRFYLSPAGQKHLQMAPTIMEDSMRQTLRYLQQKIAEHGQTPP